MEYLLIIGLLLMVWLLYHIYKTRKNYKKYFEEHSDEIIKCQQEFEERNAESQSVLQKLFVYRTLRDSITDGMPLSEMIDAFQKMCSIPVGDPDDLLFETGTFFFTDEKIFYFTLVRQFQFLDSNEYVQLHLDVHYAPRISTALLYQTKWGSPKDISFFEMVKNSLAFKLSKNQPITKVDIHIHET